MNKPYFLIGITGLMQSGKSTAADYIASDPDVEHFAFADPLREMARDINPLVHVSISGEFVYYREALLALGYEKAKATYPEFRRFLQRLGTDGIRDHAGPDFWVDIAERNIRKQILSPDTEMRGAVFSDVRFPNEAEKIQDLGGVVVRIKRTGQSGTNNTKHASETLMNDINPNMTIINDGTIDQLHSSMDSVLAVAIEHGSDYLERQEQ